MGKVNDTAKTALFILAFSIIAVAIAIGMTLLFNKYDPHASSATQNQSFVTSVKDSANIIFFVVVAAVSLLTYLQAKKTLFTPIKTETFKLQLKSFEEVLLFFQSEERDYMEKFDLRRIFDLNTSILLDDYVMTFFKGELIPNEEAINERRKELIGGVVKHEYFQQHFYLDQEEKKSSIKGQEEKDITNPAVILAKWNKYQYGFIQYTEKFEENIEKLDLFIASPLLPLKLKELIKEFAEQCRTNLTKIGEVLTEEAKELPEKYPKAQDVVEAEYHWIWNKYNRRKVDLTTKANEILAFINNYLQVEVIIE